MNDNLREWTKTSLQVIRETDKLVEWFGAGDHRLGHEGHQNWSKDRTVQLRFDAEVDENVPYEEQIRTVFRMIEFDLIDLVHNGDVTNRTDALLKSCNGVVALREKGKRINEVTVSSASLFREYKQKKNTYEYTLYIVLYLGTEDLN